MAKTLARPARPGPSLGRRAQALAPAVAMLALILIGVRREQASPVEDGSAVTTTSDDLAPRRQQAEPVDDLEARELVEPLDPVLAVVCEVVAVAGRGDAAGAKAVFLDTAHEPLHDLARERSTAGDRANAGALLEAKAVVEAADIGPSVASAEALLDATRRALIAADRPGPPPCP